MATIVVKVVKIGDAPRDVAVNAGTTIRDVISEAGIDRPDAYSVRYLQSYDEVSLSTALHADTTIVLTKKENITGGAK